MMNLAVTVEFDNAEDFFALLVRLSVPDPRFNQILERLEQMSGTMQSSLDQLSANVERITTEEAAIEALIMGIPALIQTAVDAAMAAGASPAQLQSFIDLNTALTAKAQELADDVVAGTPSGPPVDPPPVEPPPVDPLQPPPEEPPVV